MNMIRLKMMSTLAGLCALACLSLTVVAAPPTLISVTPPTTEGAGAKVTFMFDQIMSSADIDITWEGAQVDSTKFQNQWVTSMFGFPIPALSIESTYQGTLPPGVTVKYTLNKNNSGRIKNAAGQALAETSGTFVTPGTPGGNGGGDPCNPAGSTNQAAATISLSKEIHYRQTGPASPVFDASNPALVQAIVMSSTNPLPQLPTSAKLVKPDGSVAPLTKMSFDIPDIPGFPIPAMPASFFLSTAPAPEIEFPVFTSEAALNSAYPNGTYSMVVGLSTGGERGVSLPLNPSPEPPAPQIANHAALQNFNVSAPLTVRWNAFAGVSQFDSLYLEVDTKDQQMVFFAPNPCKSIELKPTDTEITIPAGTFQAATTYFLNLTFTKTTHHGENTIQGFQEYAAIAKRTQLSIGAPDQATGTNSLHFAGIKVVPGTVKLTVQGTVVSEVNPGKVEGSTDWKTWQTVGTIQKSALEQAGGRMEIQDPLPASSPARYKFYRFGLP